MSANNKQSIYRRSADAGLYIGGWLCLMSACFLFSLRMPVLGLAVFPLSLGIPVVLFYRMKVLIKTSPDELKFSSLWLFGIYAFLFGTLICMLFSGAILIFVEKGFLWRYLSNAVAQVEASPIADAMSEQTDILRQALANRLVPSPMQFVTTMGWFTTFCGSMLSMLIAGIMGRFYRRTSDNYNLN